MTTHFVINQPSEIDHSSLSIFLQTGMMKVTCDMFNFGFWLFFSFIFLCLVSMLCLVSVLGAISGCGRCIAAFHSLKDCWEKSILVLIECFSSTHDGPL